MEEPVKIIPETPSILIQVRFSFERINSFLLEDALIRNENARKTWDSKIWTTILNDNFSWDLDSGIPTLKNMIFMYVLSSLISM